MRGLQRKTKTKANNPWGLSTDNNQTFDPPDWLLGPSEDHACERLEQEKD